MWNILKVSVEPVTVLIPFFLFWFFGFMVGGILAP